MNTKISFVKYVGIFLACATLLTGCGKEKEQKTQSVDGLLGSAASYEKNGQYRAAFIELKNALKTDPTNIPAKLQIAELYLKTGQPKSAGLALESIKQTPPSSQYIELLAESMIGQEKFKSALQFIEANQKQCSSRCLTLKGDALLSQKDYAEAEKSYLAAKQMDKNNINASLGLIKTYYQEQQNDKADALMAEMLTNHSDNTDVLLLKASLLISAGKQSDAEEILNKALFTLPSTDVITPKRIVIIENLVDILTLQGRTEDALTYSKTLTDMDPKGSELRSMMDEAIEMYNAKNYEGARKILEKINQEASNSKVQTLLGVIDYMNGDFQSASNQLGANVNPENATTTTKSILINSYLNTGQSSKALEFMEKDYQLNNSDADIINLYANTLMRTGNIDKAFELMQKSLSIKPDQAGVYVSEFYYFIQKRSTKDAEQAINTAYKLAPENNTILTIYLGFLTRTNQLDAALATLDKAIEKKPADAYLFYLAGDLNTLKGNQDKALSQYKKSLELDNATTNPANLALAKYYLINKSYDKAIETYNDLIARDADLPEAYKGLMTAYELKNDKNSGIEALEKIANGKNSATANLVLAEYYLLNKNANSAVDNIEFANKKLGESPVEKNQLTAIVLKLPIDLSDEYVGKIKRILVKKISEEPNNTALLYKLIDIELAGKNIANGKELTEKLKAIDKSYAPYFYESKIALLENDPDKAAVIAKSGWTTLKTEAAANYYFTFLNQNKLPSDDFVNEWVAAFPDSYNGKLYQALAIQANDPKKAIALYEDLLKKYPDSFRTLNNLAWLYQETGDSRALVTAEKAYKANPKDAAVLDTYGWILFKNNQRKQALEIFEQAIAIDPKQPDITAHYNTVKSSANGK